MTITALHPPPENPPPDGDSKRVVSRIAFPYGDLEDAITVGDAIRKYAGRDCTTDQLAAWLGHDSVSSGSFRSRLSTARIFGIIETESDRVTLTDLGRRIVDPTHMAAAKVESFLSVPLYKEIFQQYKGFLLPSDLALEEEMVKLGVSPKQKQRARQAFQRSADQAGFFSAGRDRLVAPGKASDGETPKSRPVGIDTKVGQSTGGGGGSTPPPVTTSHPLIQGLFQTLPSAGSVWPERERVLWLEAAKTNFRLIYKDDSEDPSE